IGFDEPSGPPERHDARLVLGSPARDDIHPVAHRYEGLCVALEQDESAGMAIHARRDRAVLEGGAWRIGLHYLAVGLDPCIGRRTCRESDRPDRHADVIDWSVDILRCRRGAADRRVRWEHVVVLRWPLDPVGRMTDGEAVTSGGVGLPGRRVERTQRGRPGWRRWRDG